MQKTMIQMFVNLFRLFTNNNFFGFVKFVPVGKESDGAFFLDSVVFVSSKDFSADGTPKTVFINRIEKIAAFFSRFSSFFTADQPAVKSSIKFVFDDNVLFYSETGSKFATFIENYFDRNEVKDFNISVVTFDELFGDGKSFDFDPGVKFTAFDINKQFPFEEFNFLNEFSFFFVDAKQESLAFPFKFGFNDSTLITV